MDENKQKESYSIGCGSWLINIVVSLIFLMIYWDEINVNKILN